MTSKTNQHADLGDILGLRFECKHCQAAIVVPPAKVIKGIAKNCANCNAPWWEDREVSEALEMLVASLRKFQTFNASPIIGFSFSLELTGESDAKLLASRRSESEQ